MKKTKHSKKIAKHSMLLPIVTLALAVAVFGFMVLNNQGNGSQPDNNISSSTNYDDPTPDQISAGTAIKNDNGSKTGQDVIASPTIFLVDASQYGQNVEVRANVDNIIEDNGTCSYAFTRGADIIEEISEASANVNRTTCTPIIVPASEFPTSGSWSLVIQYSSSTSAAESSSYSVEVAK